MKRKCALCGHVISEQEYKRWPRAWDKHKLCIDCYSDETF